MQEVIIKGYWNDNKDELTATCVLGFGSDVEDDDEYFYYFDDIKDIVGKHFDFTVTDYVLSNVI